MKEIPSCDFLAILRILREHEVEFVVVGGVAAVLQGVPLTTFDLDVVHKRDRANVARLEKALESLEAYYRAPVRGRRRPETSHLLSAGHQLLMTRYGPLDLLGQVGKGRRYEDLQPDSICTQVGEGVEVHVLNLAALTRIKEETAAEKDLAVLPLLRRTLKEQASRASRPDRKPEDA
ncbi:MAG: hypothetical protein RMK57_06325 [Bryobacterales bacterium]|nr:hypothetical protein [Bryobacteraceae bacterium]MDW8354131.1 hypothetical protein [Bryobacterales bacterium]